MAKLPGGPTGIKGGQGVYGMLRDNAGIARDIMMPGKKEMASLSRRFKSGGGGLTGMWSVGSGFFNAKAPGTVGMLERHWQSKGMSALEAKGGRAFRQVAGGMALGGAMIGTSMLTGYSVFDQAQFIGGAALAGNKLGAWAKGGKTPGGRIGRQVGLGAAMVGAGLGTQALSIGEITMGAAGWGATRAAQWYGGGANKYGGGWTRAAVAGAGIGLGLLI